MAIVVIQVGQCGNQLGLEFFNTIINDLHDNKGHKTSKHDVDFRNTVIESFFQEQTDGSLVARAVLVDTEPKVVQQIQRTAKRSGTWCYSNNVYMKRQGAGNNWAYGYRSHGESARDQILNLIKGIVESAENFMGFLIIMSLAGGTGSGLGTYLTEVLREEYPQATLLNVVVWPFSLGEVAVQSYNVLLSLSHLQQHSSAVIVFENELLHKICARHLGLKEISLNDMNMLAARQLAGLLLPCCGEEGAKLHIGLLHSSPKKDLSPAFVSTLLLARGKEAHSVDAQLLSCSSMNYVSWTSSEDQPKMWYNHRPFLSYRKCVTFAINSNLIVPTLDNCVEKAWSMFLAKAYLFQYERHGLSIDDFLETFISAEHVIASYKRLCDSS